MERWREQPQRPSVENHSYSYNGAADDPPTASSSITAEMPLSSSTHERVSSGDTDVILCHTAYVASVKKKNLTEQEGKNKSNIKEGKLKKKQTVGVGWGGGSSEESQAIIRRDGLHV